MLCKIFGPEDIEVTAAPWRQQPGTTGVPPKLQSTGARGENAQLREQIDQLNTLLEQRTREAWDQGFRAGETAAHKSVDEQVRIAVQRLATTTEEVAATRPETIRRAEADTVRLAIEIARRVLHRELSLDPSALEALVKAAITKLQNQEIYKIRVHPDYEKLMRTCLEQTGRGNGVEIVCDPGQPKGGVSFEISRGTLDASVDTQLREIENGLVDQLGRRA
jgi:flagellar assembly protein FliH